MKTNPASFQRNKLTRSATLPETNSKHLARPQNFKRSSSNHPFSEREKPFVSGSVFTYVHHTKSAKCGYILHGSYRVYGLEVGPTLGP